MINLIVAMSEAARVIGLGGGMPWKLRQDLQRFKKLTTGHLMVMGRKTYQSIGKPLPNRVSVVLTRDTTFTAPGCHVYNSLPEALNSGVCAVPEIFVIGGAEVYRDALPIADRVYLTIVDYQGPGDTFFPEDPWENFVPLQPDPQLEIHGGDADNSHATRFMVMQRRTGPR